MADTPHSKCGAARRAGSSPASGILKERLSTNKLEVFFYSPSGEWSFCLVGTSIVASFLLLIGYPDKRREEMRTLRIKQRLRNYGLWIALASLVLMLLRAFGIDIVDEQYDAIIDSVLGILVLLGILNNPTSNNRGFGDDPDNP